MLREPLPDLVAGSAGAGEAQPVAAGLPRLRSENLDDIAVPQPVAQRNNPVVYFGADAAVADVRVNRIGEIKGSSAGRQAQDLALRGEDEDLVLEEIDLQALHEVPRVFDLALPFEDPPQPGEPVRKMGLVFRRLFVAPVGG